MNSIVVATEGEEVAVVWALFPDIDSDDQEAQRVVEKKEEF